MEKYCYACGMPLKEKEDFAGGNENLNFCANCADAEGNVKSCEEVFEGGVQFFMTQVGGDREKAERIVRKNMIQLPCWKDKNNEILKGELAADEEYMEVLKKLI